MLYVVFNFVDGNDDDGVNISKEKRQELDRTVTMYNVMWTRWILFFVSSLFEVAFSFWSKPKQGWLNLKFKFVNIVYLYPHNVGRCNLLDLNSV